MHKEGFLAGNEKGSGRRQALTLAEFVMNGIPDTYARWFIDAGKSPTNYA
jgi:hypothetical protein